MKNNILGSFSNLSVVGVCWFGDVGVVKVVDPYEGIKYYIGIISGEDEQQDIKRIALWGKRFPGPAGVALETEGLFKHV